PPLPLFPTRRSSDLFPASFIVPLDSRLQTIEHARHRDERGSAFAFDGSNNLRRIRGRLENHRRSKERWNKERHELSKDMAQRNRSEEHTSELQSRSE